MSKIFDVNTSKREREREWRERNVKNPLEVLIRDSFCFPVASLPTVFL